MSSRETRFLHEGTKTMLTNVERIKKEVKYKAVARLNALMANITKQVSDVLLI